MSEVLLIDAYKAMKSIDEIVCSMSVCMNSDYCHGMTAMKDAALHAIEKQPTVDAVPREWWNELESTVSKLVKDNDNFPENKQFYDCARFLLNLMGVIERRSDGRV